MFRNSARLSAISRSPSMPRRVMMTLALSPRSRRSASTRSRCTASRRPRRVRNSTRSMVPRSGARRPAGSQEFVVDVHCRFDADLGEMLPHPLFGAHPPDIAQMGEELPIGVELAGDAEAGHQLVVGDAVNPHVLRFLEVLRI